MKKLTMLLITLGFLASGQLKAQTAPVQVIHNSPDVAADTVDVFINGNRAIKNLAFREATPFTNLPAGSQINIGIAPNGASSPIKNFQVTLNSNDQYIAVVNGINQTAKYDPDSTLSLAVKGSARQQSNNSGDVDLLVHHGVTDAPTVDITNPSLGTISDDLTYGSFDGYLSVSPGQYTINVETQNNAVTVGSFTAPLSSFGDSALTVVASGFLDPSKNNLGPGFGLYAAKPSGGPLIELPRKTAEAQVIHNAPDVAADTVDVFVNGERAIQELAFHEATGFAQIPAGLVNIGIAPSGTSQIVKGFNPNLKVDTQYLAVVNGVVQSGNFQDDQPLSLDLRANARQSSQTSSDVDVLVHHGSLDAPTVDITNPSLGILSDDLSYTDFDGYLGAPAGSVAINVETQNNNQTVASFTAPLSNFNGSAVTVVASGFLDPSNNNLASGFGLYAAPASGGQLVELPRKTAEAQVIHNAPDVAADTVDVFVNGERAIQDLAFREATGFAQVPSGLVNIGIAPSGTAQIVKSFDPNLKADTQYIAVVNGVVQQGVYEDNQPLSLDLKSMARKSAGTSGNTDLLVHHGSPDAPSVDIAETSVIGGNIVNGLSYSNFEGYLSNPTADYVAEVKASASGNVVAAYKTLLSTAGLQDSALTVVASGFLDTTGNNSGPQFGLFVAPPSGGKMVALPQDSTELQIIHNSPDAAADPVDVYVDDEKLLDDLKFRKATSFVSLPAGTKEIGIAPGNGQNYVDSFDLSLSTSGNYIAVASGVVNAGNYQDDKPFNLDVKTMARKDAKNSGETDILVHHGALDAGEVNVNENKKLEATLVDSLGYGSFSDYVQAMTDNYILGIEDVENEETVEEFNAPLSDENLEGEAITVLASGFLDTAANNDGPSFGLFVATTGGNVIQLPVSQAGGILTPEAKGLKIYPNPAKDNVYIEWENRQAKAISVDLMDQNGRVLKTYEANEVKNGNKTSLGLENLDQGVYFLRIKEGNKLIKTQQIIKR